MKKEKEECKRQPKNCQCNPALREGWFKICNRYSRDKHFEDGRCVHCEHQPECHK